MAQKEISTVHSFKIVLLGDGGTGKTTYINRIKEGRFIRDYRATVGAIVHDIFFMINETQAINFQVWDTAGQEINSLLSDVYYVGAHGVIIMFDVTSRITFSNVKHWLKKVKNANEGSNIPVVVCGNKIDLKDRKVKKKQILEGLSKDITHYTDMSAKSNYNFDVPFLVLARKLTGNPNLVFVSNLSLAPAEIRMDEEAIKESRDIMQDVQMAQKIDLPDDEFI